MRWLVWATIKTVAGLVPAPTGAFLPIRCKYSISPNWGPFSFR